ncbi:MAG: GNAT family protein [Peptostreptococcaceae bacterium]|nr:GNAT family protein [Peptostreptococcaceae bacterium]
MNKVQIRAATLDDAPKMLDFVKAVAMETDFLILDEADALPSVDEERAFILSTKRNPKDCLFLAICNNEVVGMANFKGNPRVRISHHGEIGISVRKKYWGKEVATRLMAELIHFAESIGVTIIHLLVRSDNERAIAFYKKIGFEQDGKFKNYIKIGDEYFDSDHMSLHL